MKLTDPLPATTFPERPGVYLTQRGDWGQKFWRAFDGKNWHYGVPVCRHGESPSYEYALQNPVIEKEPREILQFTWQGLAEKPE